MILNLDLDGVFSDMESSVKELAGFEYHMDPKLAWSVVDKIDNFFLNLKPLKEAAELFNLIYVNSVYPVRILTALPIISNKLITAERDKKAWVAKYLSEDIEVICVKDWSHKKTYCRFEDILVDDSARNCLDWISVGGQGILHFSDHPYDTIVELKDKNVFGRKHNFI
jgi:hypothetical protein